MGKLIFIIILTFILSIIVILKIEKREVKYVRSKIDNEEYLVRDMPDKEAAADLLATIKKNIMTLDAHLFEHRETKYKDELEAITQLHEKIADVVINESTDDSAYTSYSVNKGEQIVFCLRSKSDKSLHDINLIMYVVLHEIAHVGCKEYGHTPLFKRIFAFFTKVAIDIGLYTKLDFNNEPVEYCGLMISESII